MRWCRSEVPCGKAQLVLPASGERSVKAAVDEGKSKNQRGRMSAKWPSRETSLRSKSFNSERGLNSIGVLADRGSLRLSEDGEPTKK